MKTHKVIHRREKCIGCNSCCVIAPNTWEMEDSDGKSRLRHGVKRNRVEVAEIFDDELAANKRAAAACPTKIIAVEEN